MILTKQLQAVIDSSLAQGRDYEDIRAILMKQGFQDADISELFAQHRSVPQSVQQSKISTDTDLGLIKTVPQQTQKSSVPQNQVSAKEQLFNQNFVHPEVKPGFVPIGFEKESTPQSQVKSDIDTFMNIGTNTQTAAHMVNAKQGEKLPAPGTVPLPSELKNTPKLINESGFAEGEQQEQVIQQVPQTKIQEQQYINVGFAGMPEMEKVLAEEQSKKIEKSPWPLLITLIVLVALIGGFFYWFFVLSKDSGEVLESEKLLQELQAEKTKQSQPETPPSPTGPVDPFTNEPIQN